AAYVYAQVTELSVRVFKTRQAPQMKITANYPLVKQTHVLPDTLPIVAETKPTHRLNQTAQLVIRPGIGQTVVRSLSVNTPLTLMKNEGGWTLVASGGKPLGYVATRDLTPVQ